MMVFTAQNNTYKDYTTTLENAKQHIAEKGVAVIPNVLTSEEIQLYRGNMWNMLSQLFKMQTA